jgi:antagonist of KipI
MALRIVKTGFPMSLQDGGRRGYRALGVPISGPMDADAHRIANLICGNDPGATAVELTLHGAVMMAEVGLCMAHVGGGSQLYVNGEAAPGDRLIRLSAFSLLEFRPSGRGCRSYLAIPGGFSARCDLGSASTYVPAQLGGQDGRYLRVGDWLTAGDQERAASLSVHEGVAFNASGWSPALWGVSSQVYTASAPLTVRVLPGPEWDQFTESCRDGFLSSPYRLTQDSGRMGYRLEGPTLDRREAGEMLSTAVCAGTLQVPHSGKPVLLMSDAQTVGGYPRIASVFSADLPGCGQLRPGDSIRFVPGTMDEAESAHRLREQRFRELQRAIRLRFGH